MKVWLDGGLRPADEARIAPLDRGLLLGDGLFETLRARAGRIVRLEAHLARLRAGAKVLGLALPPLDLEAVLHGVLRANALEDASLRLTVTRGAGPRGLLPPLDAAATVLVTAAPLGAAPEAVRCIVSQRTRRNEHSPLSRIKSLNGLDNILARLEADEAGADEALLLNTAGRVTEATISNVFVRAGGRLVTPPVAEGVLPGVARSEVIALGAEERPLAVEDVLGADEVFLTNSLSVRRVTVLDGRVLAGTETPDLARLRRHLLG